MNNLFRLLLLILAAGPLASGARAAYDDVGVSARVTGFGGAFTAVADDVYSVYYNPAGLATLERPELATSYSKLVTGLSDGSNLQNSFLGYARPLDKGRLGGFGVAWNHFSLDSLYREMSFFGSYGRRILPERVESPLFAGVSLKVLRRSLGSVAQADAPIGPTGAVVPGRADPVLQNRSKMNLDADLGFLYRVKPRWSAGLMVQHLLEPNIAFSDGDTDKLGRNIKLGGAYKTPFSTLAADLGFLKAPDGSTDKTLTLAAEKWLPTLVHGSFGLRGSLGLGSRDFRQLTVGLSYKIHRLQFDYGFAIPFAGVTGTYGSHRLGLTFRFGRPRHAEPSYAEAMLENMQELARVNTPEFEYQMADLAQHRREAIEEFLKAARFATSRAQFGVALGYVKEALALKPGDELMTEAHRRLGVVSGFYPAIEGYRVDPASAAVYEGIMEYLAHRDWEAGGRISYALGLDPKNETLRGLLTAIGASVQAPAAEGAKPSPAPGVVPAAQDTSGDMALVEVALREKEYDRVLALAGLVLRKDPASSLAYMRMGTAYYNLQRYPEALQVLESAFALETDAEFKKTLRQYITAIAEVNAAVEAAKAAVEKAKVVPAAPGRPARPMLSPQEVERLYEAGVDLYAQRRFAEAAALFKRILAADPHNVSARRALDRVEAESRQGGAKP